MNIVYYVCEFLWVAVKIWMTFEILGVWGEPRLKKERETAAKCAIMFLVAGLDIGNQLTAATLFSSGLLVISCVLIGVGGSFLYQIKPMKGIVISYLYWIVIAYLDFFFQIILYAVSVGFLRQPPVFLQISWARAVYLLISVWAVIGLGVAGRRKSASQYKRMRFGKTIAALSVVGSLCLTPYMQHIYWLEISTESMGVGEIVAFGAIIFFLSAGAAAVWLRWRQEEKLIQVKMDALWAGYMQTKVLYQEKSRLLHDEVNHIRAVRNMIAQGKIDRALAYLDELSGMTERQRFLTYVTGHEFLDMLLGLKAQQAEAEMIKLEFDFDYLRDIRLTDVELCSLFANLLDNGIEANQSLPAKKRWIKLTGKGHGQTLVITLTNPAAVEGTLKGEEVQTTKDQRYHGFGMQNIKTIAERYDGYLEYGITDRTFSLLLTLECLEKDNAS